MLQPSLDPYSDTREGAVLTLRSSKYVATGSNPGIAVDVIDNGLFFGTAFAYLPFAPTQTVSSASKFW